jgi:hypothetical protein
MMRIPRPGARKPSRHAKRARAAKLSRLVPVVPQPLTWGERLDILDTLSHVLDGVYAHLPLKRSLYGFDILRVLEQLRQQVPTLTDLAFHRELTLAMNRLRDAHTQYVGPWRVFDDEPVATLPFLVEVYGPVDSPTYIVSKVDRRSVKDAHFVKRVQITHWNGVPFDRAVDLYAEVETGGRPDSRRARALESLTFRSLEYAPPPNEEWVVIAYKDLKGTRGAIHLARPGPAARTHGEPHAGQSQPPRHQCSRRSGPPCQEVSLQSCALARGTHHPRTTCRIG